MSHIYLAANTNIQPKKKTQCTPQNVLKYFTQGGIVVTAFQGRVRKGLHLPCCLSLVGENTWWNLLAMRPMQMQEDQVWAVAQREELLMSNCSMKSAQKHRCTNVTRTISNLPQSLWSSHTALFYQTLEFPFMISASWSIKVFIYLFSYISIIFSILFVWN